MTDALIDLLSDVSHRFQQRLRDEVQAADIDLTPFEAKALVTIARLPGSTQQAIAGRMGCDKAQLARAVKVLEARSLVTRNASAEDWRAWDMVLTPSGETIFADLQAGRANISRVCLANVSFDEREMLSDILIKMLDGLESGQNR
ncbi:MAG: MarR family winged helix-turn-helix transcriptional regulator [Novosphingobium sp.]|uniref:MarR family winged helix-turn-helix transcriptional regulator n=1 Tax=Novosphingobium sp. TaxID=1874826 RepID=UPI002735C9FB|nr:MarR family winged helix-turn-helix transcriptional regulator [Novosphingobium sp.]MDP3549243.1 MarR family winged helix-turn-helix transcriptional regulator [Novosphingobium sp.]